MYSVIETKILAFKKLKRKILDLKGAKHTCWLKVETHSKRAQYTHAGLAAAVCDSPSALIHNMSWNAYSELLTPTADHHCVFLPRDANWLTHSQIYTLTHRRIDKLQGWVDSCGVRGNTHLEKCLLCCQVGGCQKDKGGGEGRDGKGKKCNDTHRRHSRGVLYTLVVNKLLQLSQSMEGKAIAHMNPELNLKKKKRAPR